MPITQKQVARKLGLSQGAVALGLSDSLHAQSQLRPETRLKIRETARRMGYVPHRAARRLARQRAGKRSVGLEQVGMIHFLVGNDFVRHAITDGAEDALAKLAGSLTLVRVTGPADWEKVERLTGGGGVDGWLVYGPVDDAIMERLNARDMPCVVVGDHYCTRPVHNATPDNRAAGRLAAQHLASLGHRRIAYIATGLKRKYQREMLEGYRAARREFGLDEDERLIVDKTTWDRADVAAPIEWLQSHHPMPTAVVVPEWGVAMGLNPAMRNWPSPEIRAMSLMGSTIYSPGQSGHDFTSVDPRMNEVGKAGVALLHRLATTGEGGTELIAPAVFEGNSTRPPVAAESID